MHCHNIVFWPALFQMFGQIIDKGFDLKGHGRAVLDTRINIQWFCAGLARFMAVLEQGNKLARLYIGSCHELRQARDPGAVDGHLGQCINVIADGIEIQGCVRVLAPANKPPAQQASVQRIAKAQAGVLLEVFGGAGDTGPLQISR